MAKTYVPTLRIVANAGYRYASRWQTKLEQNLTPEQYTCLGTWIAATLALLVCIGAAPIEP